MVWTFEQGEDLNANLVRFAPGEGIGEHVNDEVDVLVLGVAGSGVVSVDGDERSLVPVHRRRGPLRIGG